MSFNKVTREDRIGWIKSMYDVIIDDGDERIYMRWIMIVPDEPQEDDFEFIADDEELWDDCWNFFKKYYFC